MENPFVTNGYVSDAYFCDREMETKSLIDFLVNGNNVALISPRRYGKSDLIHHCFAQPVLKEHYYIFFIDVYATRTLSDFVNQMVKGILSSLKSWGRRALDAFLSTASSLQANISYDMNGNPSLSVGLGSLKQPTATLDEIFRYLWTADKPCIVAIDEFQQITNYSDENVETSLRTYIQQCGNARFVFSGSRRHLMTTMFTSPARPFYQSVTLMNLKPIPLTVYSAFAQKMFSLFHKKVDSVVVETVYQLFDGTTFYLQKVMNTLFMRTPAGEICGLDMMQAAIRFILDFAADAYSELIIQLPDRQSRVLLAVANEEVVKNVQSSEFIKKYNLPSASSVASAIKGLLDRDILTRDGGVIRVSDRFLGMWIKQHYFDWSVNNLFK